MTQGCETTGSADGIAQESCHWSQLCEHRDTEVRKTVNRAGVRIHVRQCMRCGRSLGQVKRIGIAAPFDQELLDLVVAEYTAFHESRVRRWQEEEAARLNQREERRRRRQREYEQYLSGPVWRRKRALVMRRCDGVCEACGVEEATQVHHVAYPENFGEEPLWDLRGVCRSCHRLIHGRAG
jgi:hypothetical protein